jgi:hypothetical protein
MFTAANLLDLVRKLIDYGRDLASTLHQRAAADPYFTRTFFGSSDLKQVLARITRGLQLAGMLEARLIQRAAQPPAAPTTAAAASRSAPCTTRPAAQRTEPACADSADLPTAEQIAARFRRQPIGAAIADICRDLGIMPSHPLWREVARAMGVHGGNLARLLNDLIHRSFQPLIAGHILDDTPALFLPPPALGGTGPP